MAGALIKVGVLKRAHELQEGRVIPGLQERHTKTLSRTTSRPPGVMSQLPAATFPRRAYPTSPALQLSMASAIRRAPTRIHNDTPVTKTKEDDLSLLPSSTHLCRSHDSRDFSLRSSVYGKLYTKRPRIASAKKAHRTTFLATPRNCVL